MGSMDSTFLPSSDQNHPCCSSRARLRATPALNEVRQYLLNVPTVYAEAVAAGPPRSSEVAWMQRVGLVRAGEKMREANLRRQQAFEAAQQP